MSELTAVRNGGTRQAEVIPRNDYVYIRKVRGAETSQGGIVLPESAMEKQRGVVLAVGPGRWLEMGKRGELGLKEGDEVLWGGGIALDVEHFLVPCDHVVAVVR